MTTENIEEFTDTFAKRVAIMPWQMSIQYKRAITLLDKTLRTRLE